MEPMKKDIIDPELRLSKKKRLNEFSLKKTFNTEPLKFKPSPA